MAAKQLLCRRQAKAGSVRASGNQRVENRVLHVHRNTWSIIFDFYGRNNAVSCIADRKVCYRATAQRQCSLAIKSGHISARILDKEEEVDRLAQLLRHDRMENTFEGREQILEELKGLIAQNKGKAVP